MLVEDRYPYRLETDKSTMILYGFSREEVLGDVRTFLKATGDRIIFFDYATHDDLRVFSTYDTGNLEAN